MAQSVHTNALHGSSVVGSQSLGIWDITAAPGLLDNWNCAHPVKIPFGWKGQLPQMPATILCAFKLAGRPPDFCGWLLAVCLVAFAGFLPCDELIKLRCKDLSFNEQGMLINIVSSKADQYR